MKKVVVIGEILVEIMADTVGDGFLEPLALTGPFPSGAPAIFIDQVAKIGQPCAIISAVGNDDFGEINRSRLARDGVDVSAISIDASRPTGSAFVRYHRDGTRDFVYNIKHSACGSISKSDEAVHVLNSADHVHVMGSSLSSPELVRLNLETVRSVKARNGTVSFDPNTRKELFGAPNLREAMKEILSLSDVFLPSGEELTLLTQANDPDTAVAELLALGIECIVHKLGSEGVRHHNADGSQFVPAFAVKEIDPTGAGDCFGGAFTALWLQGYKTDEVLRLASAAGARAVLHRGPMEGASDLETLVRFANEHAEQWKGLRT